MPKFMRHESKIKAFFNKKPKIMRKTIVIGAARFIASHLAETFLKKGEEVIGVDEFNNYYDLKFKCNNIADLQKYSNFKLHRGRYSVSRLADTTYRCRSNLSSRRASRGKSKLGSRFSFLHRTKYKHDTNFIRSCKKC